MIVVTGGAGFIGSNLVAALNARGETEIVICDRLRDGPKWRNIAKAEIAGFTPPEQLFAFMNEHRNRIRAVFHLGACSTTTETDADRIANDNLRYSLSLWNWCAQSNGRLIYASSAATYGDGAQGFVDDDSIEGLAKLVPLNAYAWSKHAFDRRAARIAGRAEGVGSWTRPAAFGDISVESQSPRQWFGLKFFNVYGPNEVHKGG
ncbi:MAG: NAD-dependent epimerase/dehydratase family protein, partial [Pseudomonadota bacterium]